MNNSVIFVVSEDLKEDGKLEEKFEKRIRELILIKGACWVNASPVHPIGNVEIVEDFTSNMVSGQFSKYQHKLGDGSMGYISAKLEFFGY